MKDGASLSLVLMTDAPPLGLALLCGADVLAQEVLPSRGMEASFWSALDRVMRASPRPLLPQDTLKVSAGPGSFTGVRLGFAAAYGVSMALGCQCVGVDRFVQALPPLKDEDVGRSQQEFLVVLSTHRRDEWFVQRAKGEQMRGAPLVLTSDLEAMVDVFGEDAFAQSMILCGEGAAALLAHAGAHFPVVVSATKIMSDTTTLSERALRIEGCSVGNHKEPPCVTLPHYVRPLAFRTRDQRRTGA